jgi:hypothetical protein
LTYRATVLHEIIRGEKARGSERREEYITLKERRYILMHNQER